MGKGRIAFFLKRVLALIMLATFSSSWAEGQDYKHESSVQLSSRKLYKGEEETTTYASNFVPKEAKYDGQVYSSNLYQGPIEGPGYTPHEARSLHDGFYVGAEAGYDSYKMLSNINIISGGLSVFQQNPELNAVGISYSLIGGYGRVFDEPLYLGAELFYNYSQANTSQNVGVFNGTSGVYYLKSLILGSYGLSLLPGIKLGESALFYLKGGYTRIEAKTYENSGALGVNNAQSNGANGVHYGLGFEAEIYKNWSIRGEYTHLNAKQFTTSVGTNITPSDNQFMFALILHFI